MCTISWRVDPSGLTVYCNRDEIRTREAALPTRAFTRKDIACLAPLDGRAGGTWIGVNEHGLCATLLNHYIPSASKREHYTSRGELVMDALGCQSVEEVGERLRAEPLDEFRPFILLAFQFAGGQASTRAFRWERDGVFVEETVRRMVTSSSFMTRDVIASREATYAKMLEERGDKEIDDEFLEALHRSHHPTKGAYSVCMHRPDAQTVSHTQVRIGLSTISLRYWPASLCQEPTPIHSSLPHRSAPLPVAKSMAR